MITHLNPGIQADVNSGNASVYSCIPTVKGRLFKIILMVILFITCMAQTAHSQATNEDYNQYGSGIGLSLGAGVDVPLHNLNGIYKAAPAFNAGVTKVFNKFVVGAHIGYTAYQPKGSAYSIDNTYTPYDGSQGSVSYSKYSVISLYTSAQYDFEIGNVTSLYAGINLGDNFVNYSYHIKTASYDNDQNVTEGHAYVAPKLGFSFVLSDNIKLGIETRYNVFGSASYNYNTIDGSSGSSVLYTSWTSGITLNYRF